MEANLVSPNSIPDLYKNVISVGHNDFFAGVVTDEGKKNSKGVQKLIYYLENAREFGNLPGAGSRESPLLEYQDVERAKIGIQTEITRSETAIKVLTDEMNRRAGAK